MRQIVLDTETTGLEVAQDHRIIEIGAVEVENRKITGRHYHQYIQPDRLIDAGAMEVHGITESFLSDKPRFAQIADEFLNFIEGAEVIIHNAPFDVAFLDYELRLCNANTRMNIVSNNVVDSLVMARKMYPGQRNNLDALCKRLGVGNAHRTLHGALLDSEILADVYLLMTGGQEVLSLEVDETTQSKAQGHVLANYGELPVVSASASELKAHETTLQRIDDASPDGAVWRSLLPG